MDYGAGIIIICELKTSNFYDFDRAEFDRILGYTVHLESARCAIYVRNDLKKRIKKIRTISDQQPDVGRQIENRFHSCAISISDENSHQKLLVISCYRSPSSAADNAAEILETAARVGGEHTHTIIAGDFNVHHERLGGQKTDKAGKLLLDVLENSTYHVLKRLPHEKRSGPRPDPGRRRDSSLC